MGRCIGVGDRHDHGKGGAVGGGGVPLLAVDDVIVAVLDGGGLHHHRVRARHLDLGHREAAANSALDQRLQPPFLLLVGPVEVEDLDVAGVGGVAVEDEVAERGAAEDLGNQSEVDQAETHTAVLPGMARRPQAHLTDSFTFLLDFRQELAEGFAEKGLFHRQKLAVDELAHHGEHGLDLFIQ